MTLLLHCMTVLLLALIVSVACRLGHLRPALCHALWLVVLVELIVPPVVAWPWGAIDLSTPIPAPSAVSGVIDQSNGTAIARFSPGIGSAAESAIQPTALDPWGPLGNVALTLWLAGSLIILGQLYGRVSKVRQMVASGSPVPEWLDTQLQKTCATLDMAMPKATVIPSKIGGIRVHYFGRPTLVLSQHFLESMEASQWDTILTHEMAHLKRRDHWTAWLIIAASLLWWWNPCLWWVRRQLSSYSELACDAWVVNTHPDERKNYAETMVKVLSLLSERADPAPIPGLAFWSSASQERRLWMVMKGTGTCRLGRHYGVGLVLLAVLLAPACVNVGNQDGTAAVEERLETGPSSATWTLPTKTSAALEESLKQSISVRFENHHLADIFAYIRETYHVNIVIDPRAVQSQKTTNVVESDKRIDGILPFVNLQDSALGDSLQAICRPLGLVPSTYGNVVWITNEALQQSDEALPLPLSSRSGESAMLDELQKSINVELENMHLKDALEIIQDRANINIVLDKRVFLPEVDGTLETALEGVTDGMIRRVALNNVSVAEALYTIARMLNLTYRADDGFVYIATPEMVASDPFRNNESLE